MTRRTCRRRLACIAATLTVGCLIIATTVPHRVRAQVAAEAGDDAQAARMDRCSRIPPGTEHPPANFTPVTLQVLQRSVEPVPATDGLIHLVYAAQVTNLQTTPADIVSVMPVDPSAGFAPTGRNLVMDAEGRYVAGKVRLFGAPPGDSSPVGGPEAESAQNFTTRVPPGGTGVMFFDVTYTDPASIPRLLAHAITLAAPDGGPGTPALTNPVPVGCLPLAVLQPPLMGRGWTAFGGCCTFAAYHRDQVQPINGVLKVGQQFAIDFEQVGPNGSCCDGPHEVVESWWGYNTPVLAAAPGVVVEAVDGMPDQQPVGTIKDVDLANAGGNRVIVDIGGGRYVAYGHLRPGSIPARVREGARLRAGELIGRVGNSGNSSAPHLHLQVMDSPSIVDATGLPFVFASQLLEGRVPEGVEPDFDKGAVVAIDRTDAGLRRDLMPSRHQVFGFNLSR
jgi:hypothetical protein